MKGNVLFLERDLKQERDLRRRFLLLALRRERLC